MDFKQSPFQTPLVFLRVLVKALIVVAVVNVALLAVGANPVRALVQLNTFDLLGRSRPRLAYPTDFQNGQLPVEALLAAHAISQPKAPGEYRVVLLGDSGIAGWGVPDDETLAAELTDLGIRTQGRRVVAYNLAYPQPSAARDLIILDAALRYEPDLIVWFVTPAALNNAPDAAGQNRVFYDLNAGRLATLAAEHDALIGDWILENADALLGSDEPGWQRYVAIRDQELLPVWLNALFYPLLEPGLAPSDRRVGTEAVPAEARYTSSHPGFREMPNAAWQFLRAGCREARASGAQLLVVNQPMAIGESGAQMNYNLLYGRDLYDGYREALVWFTDFYGLAYVDLWDEIPAARFTDTPTHMDALGYKMLAARLQDDLRTGRGSTCE